MNRALAGALVAAAALVLFGALFLLRAPRNAAKASADEAATPAAGARSDSVSDSDTAAASGSEPEANAGQLLPPAPETPRELRSVTLWLPALAGRIAPTTVEIESAPEPKERIEALLRALLTATPAPPLSPLFVSEVQLVATLRGADATLFVDLAAADGGGPPASGSELELQRVYSIVHTVVRNEPSVTRVVLLWNGTQRPSLSGHVDTGHALEPRSDLERGSEGGR